METCKDWTSRLPVLVLEKIILELDLSSIKTCEQVCTYWRDVIERLDIPKRIEKNWFLMRPEVEKKSSGKIEDEDTRIVFIGQDIAVLEKILRGDIEVSRLFVTDDRHGTEWTTDLDEVEAEWGEATDSLVAIAYTPDIYRYKIGAYYLSVGLWSRTTQEPIVTVRVLAINSYRKSICFESKVLVTSDYDDFRINIHTVDHFRIIDASNENLLIQTYQIEEPLHLYKNLEVYESEYIDVLELHPHHALIQLVLTFDHTSETVTRVLILYQFESGGEKKMKECLRAYPSSDLNDVSATFVKTHLLYMIHHGRTSKCSEFRILDLNGDTILRWEPSQNPGIGFTFLKSKEGKIVFSVRSSGVSHLDIWSLESVIKSFEKNGEVITVNSHLLPVENDSEILTRRLVLSDQEGFVDNVFLSGTSITVITHVFNKSVWTNNWKRNEYNFFKSRELC